MTLVWIAYDAVVSRINFILQVSAELCRPWERDVKITDPAAGALEITTVEALLIHTFWLLQNLNYTKIDLS